ncbi:YcnI family protein [Vallicoccus soli]|uniref:DUF1775 domain-containing protein n=1 Tax=Vallicoccus soli TaxID=2339232 RepID=A0A3A3YXV9_9ACTN|nr:YcnI family protein [Vallicoccus soli]RJK94793.1 DUF1775 domain-containing protein [Vallicoccus soli]
MPHPKTTPTRRRAARAAAAAAGLTALGAALAGPAAAHVTAVAPAGATAGGYAKVVLTVPTERDDAGTTALAVELPQDTPLASVRARPLPGWDVALTTTRLPEPVATGTTTLSEAVTRVTWTAQEGTRIAPGEFEEFSLSLGPLPDVDELVLPATQTYDSGEVVAWDQPPTGGEEPEHPAPVVAVEPAAPGGEGGHGHGADPAADGSDAQPVAATRPAAAGDDVLARSLGGAGLVLGAGALGLAARRRRA